MRPAGGGAKLQPDDLAPGAVCSTPVLDLFILRCLDQEKKKKNWIKRKLSKTLYLSA